MNGKEVESLVLWILRVMEKSASMSVAALLAIQGNNKQ